MFTYVRISYLCYLVWYFLNKEAFFFSRNTNIYKFELNEHAFAYYKITF